MEKWLLNHTGRKALLPGMNIKSILGYWPKNDKYLMGREREQKSMITTDLKIVFQHNSPSPSVRK